MQLKAYSLKLMMMIEKIEHILNKKNLTKEDILILLATKDKDEKLKIFENYISKL